MRSAEYLELFMVEQQKVMDEYDIEKGCSWPDTPIHELTDNLFEEIEAFKIKDDPERNLLDIANSCYILWAKRNFHS